MTLRDHADGLTGELNHRRWDLGRPSLRVPARTPEVPAARIVRRVAIRAVITKPVGPHTLRHTFITAAQIGRIAFDATFGRPSESLLPAVQRAALERVQSDDGPRTMCDLGCQQPVVLGATMMHLAPLPWMTG